MQILLELWNLMLLKRRNLWDSYFRFLRNLIKSCCPTNPLIFEATSSIDQLPPLYLWFSGISVRVFFLREFSLLFWFFHLILCYHLGQFWANWIHLSYISLLGNWRLFQIFFRLCIEFVQVNPTMALLFYFIFAVMFICLKRLNMSL